jgi:hypothetical protein
MTFIANFHSVTWMDDECIESLSAGYSASLIDQNHIDVLFGPSCAAGLFRVITFLTTKFLLGLAIAGFVTAFYDIAEFAYGTVSPTVSSQATYPTVVTIRGSTD